MSTPPGGWVRYNEQVAVLGCDHLPDTWEVVCRGSFWEGETRHCIMAQTETSTEEEPARVSFPFGLMAVVIISLAVAVWILILSFGLACLKRRARTYDSENVTAVLPCYNCRDEDSQAEGNSSFDSQAASTINPKRQAIVCTRSKTRHTSTRVHSVENEGFSCDKRLASCLVSRRVATAELAKVTGEPPTLKLIQKEDVVCEYHPEIRSLYPYTAGSLPVVGLEPNRAVKPDATDFNASRIASNNPMLPLTHS